MSFILHSLLRVIQDVWWVGMRHWRSWQIISIWTPGMSTGWPCTCAWAFSLHSSYNVSAGWPHASNPPSSNLFCYRWGTVKRCLRYKCLLCAIKDLIMVHINNSFYLPYLISLPGLLRFVILIHFPLKHRHKLCTSSEHIVTINTNKPKWKNHLHLCFQNLRRRSQIMWENFNKTFQLFIGLFFYQF